MEDSTLTTDPAGNALTFMGLQSTCRDLARFGWLIAEDGAWGDDRIVPAAWIEESTGAPSQDLNAAYGYLGWLNRQGRIAGAASPLRLGEDEGATTGQMGERKSVVEGKSVDVRVALGGRRTIK